jgi:hypothetical protein
MMEEDEEERESQSTWGTPVAEGGTLVRIFGWPVPWLSSRLLVQRSHKGEKLQVDGERVFIHHRKSLVRMNTKPAE